MDWIATVINGLLIGGLYGLFGLGQAFASNRSGAADTD